MDKAGKWCPAKTLFLIDTLYYNLMRKLLTKTRFKISRNSYLFRRVYDHTNHFDYFQYRNHEDVWRDVRFHDSVTEEELREIYEAHH